MGAGEHRHKQIIEVGLSLHSHSKLPQQFWEDVFLTATYIINRLPTPILNQKSSYEIVYRHTPDYHFLEVFGCACWLYLRPYNKHKIIFKSKNCIFIGYSLDHHGYKCLDLVTGKVYVSRHLIFYENHFPYKNPDHHPSICPDTTSTVVLFSNIISSLSLTPAGTCATSPSPHIDSHLPVSSSTPEQAPQSLVDTTPASLPIPVPNPTTTIPAISNTHPMVIRSKNHISKPKRTPNGHTLYPLPQVLHVSASPSCKEPTSFTEASKSCHWQSAMNSEFDALLRNQTWELVPPSLHLNIIGCRWIFKIKRKADGSIERYKARLVAKGYQ